MDVDLAIPIPIPVGPPDVLPPGPAPAPTTVPFDLAALALEGVAAAPELKTASAEFDAPPFSTDEPEGDGSPLPDSGIVLPVVVTVPRPVDASLPVIAPSQGNDARLRTGANPDVLHDVADSLGDRPQCFVTFSPGLHRAYESNLTRDEMPAPEQRPVVVPYAADQPILQVLIPMSEASSPMPGVHIRSLEPEPMRPDTKQFPEMASPNRQHDDFSVETATRHHFIDAVRIETSSAKLVEALSSALPSVNQSLVEQGIAVGSVSVSLGDRSPGPSSWHTGPVLRAGQPVIRTNLIHRKMRFTAYA